MATTLTARALRLVTNLPGSAGELTCEHLEQMASLQRSIGKTNTEIVEQIEASVGLAVSRGLGEDEPVGKYLSQDELAMLERCEDRARDVQAAERTLRDWERRSGLDEALW